MKNKVLAYILRNRNRTRELLVFTQHGSRDAGIQIPGGTVEDGEELEYALFREIKEETGLTNFLLTEKAGETIFFNTYRQEKQHRHFYVLQADSNVPDEWEHTVTGSGEDEGEVYQYYWVPIDCIPVLAASQDECLGEIRIRIEKG